MKLTEYVFVNLGADTAERGLNFVKQLTQIGKTFGDMCIFLKLVY